MRPKPIPKNCKISELLKSANWFAFLWDSFGHVGQLICIFLQGWFWMHSKPFSCAINWIICLHLSRGWFWMHPKPFSCAINWIICLHLSRGWFWMHPKSFSLALKSVNWFAFSYRVGFGAINCVICLHLSRDWFWTHLKQFPKALKSTDLFSFVCGFIAKIGELVCISPG